jgi:ankyrin repeat protein
VKTLPHYSFRPDDADRRHAKGVAVPTPTLPLPDEPSFEQLRNQARELQRAVRSGAPEALAEVVERHPQPPSDPAAVAAFRLSAAQLVIARRYDFDSWTRLKRHVELIERYSRFPGRLVTTDPADLGARFLRQACLSYEDVGPAEWSQARALLAEHPEITAEDVYVASAAGDTTALRRILRADPAAASREGGPYRWEPLMYLAYARHDPAISADAVLGAARLLLNAGASPNAGYLWHGLPTPFTVLTGVFGEGEGGPEAQPRHPHSLALARMLLEAGADPNDGQALYNRMFLPDNDHLELLFEFGLGSGDGGPWKRRMGDALAPPAEMLRGELAWAITHGLAERVRLLAEHGVDLLTPYPDGTTTTALAATTGHRELIEFLVSRGAPSLELSPQDAYVAAVLAADRTGADQLRRAHPGLAEDVRAARPGLVVWAAATGSVSAVELLVELGFDVNAMGRADVPSNEPWQTALHRAADDGDLELAQALLRLGADPDIRDSRFGGTPLDWAHHFDRQPVISLLEPATTPKVELVWCSHGVSRHDDDPRSRRNLGGVGRRHAGPRGRAFA